MRASLSSKHKPVKPGAEIVRWKMWILVDNSRAPRALLHILPWIALSLFAGTYPPRPRRLPCEGAALCGGHGLQPTLAALAAERDSVRVLLPGGPTSRPRRGWRHQNAWKIAHVSTIRSHASTLGGRGHSVRTMCVSDR